MSDEKKNPLLVAVDDGYAQTKLYGETPDGKVVKFRMRSSVRSGRSGIGSISGDGFIGLYETEIGPFTVSEDIESEKTMFDGFHTSPMNRVLVNHALVTADDGVYSGQPIQLVTGLPVGDFFLSGFKDNDKIDAKRRNLLQPIKLLSGDQPVPVIEDVVVGCQAVAAWVDYALDDDLNERGDFDGAVAIVDVGGRTTDIATVIGGQKVDHQRSGTANIGVLNVYEDVKQAINTEFKLRDPFAINVLDQAVRTGKIRLWGKEKDVKALVDGVVAEYQGKIAREVERQIGMGATLSAVVFVGGGSALFSGIAELFPNGLMADDPEFANARGLFKYARYKAQA